MNSTKPEPMPDPLIDEIRAIRAKISAQFDNDVNKLCDHLREVEKSMPNRIIRELPPSKQRKQGAAG